MYDHVISAIAAIAVIYLFFTFAVGNGTDTFSYNDQKNSTDDGLLSGPAVPNGVVFKKPFDGNRSDDADSTTTAATTINDSSSIETSSAPAHFIDPMIFIISLLVAAALIALAIIIIYMLVKRRKQEFSGSAAAAGATSRQAEKTFSATVLFRRRISRWNNKLVLNDDAEGGSSSTSSSSADKVQISISQLCSREEIVLDPVRFMMSAANQEYDETEQGEQQQQSPPYTLIPAACVDLVEVIGQGQYGDVYRAFFNLNLFHEIKLSKSSSSSNSLINVESTDNQQQHHQAATAATASAEADQRQVVAVKMMKPADNANIEVAQRAFLREAAFMNSFAHPNITQLVGVVFNGE